MNRNPDDLGQDQAGEDSQEVSAIAKKSPAEVQEIIDGFNQQLYPFLKEANINDIDSTIAKIILSVSITIQRVFHREMHQFTDADYEHFSIPLKKVLLRLHAFLGKIFASDQSTILILEIRAKKDRGEDHSDDLQALKKEINSRSKDQKDVMRALSDASLVVTDSSKAFGKGDEIVLAEVLQEIGYKLIDASAELNHSGTNYMRLVKVDAE